MTCPVSLTLQLLPQRTWCIGSEADDILLVHDQEMQLGYAQVLEI